MKNQVLPHCARCENKECRGGKDCFNLTEDQKILYQDAHLVKLHRTASAIEARYYGQQTRLGEIILWARQMKWQKLGLAFCIGLSEEAKVIDQILAEHFEVFSVCCKACALRKDDFSLEKIEDDSDEIMCNPAGQADLLYRAGAELNILCGLCVGHDAIFNQASKAPVTTLIAKDRVLGHNPAAAIYCRYVRRKLENLKP